MTSAAVEPGSGLYLPSSVVDEIAEERAIEMLRAQGRLDFPIEFHGNVLNLRGLGKQPRQASLLEEGAKGWAAIANRAIADRLASLRMFVFEMIQEEKVAVSVDHPMQVVLNRPGPIFSIELLLILTAWHLQAAGEAYWQKVTDGIGVTRQLWPLPPQNVDPLPGRDGTVIGGYAVRDGTGRTHTLAENEVIRIWRPDPSSIYSSLGVLGPQATEWDAERFRIEHLRMHFKNDATPRVAIVGQSDAIAPDKTAKDNFAIDWRNRFHGRMGRDRGVPAFIPPGFAPHEFDAHGGITELVPLGEKASEQFLAAYGVPGSIAGMMVDVNRAAAETAQFTMDQNTVAPITRLIAGAVMQQLAPDFDPTLIVEFDDFVAKDKEHILKREDQDAKNKIRTGQQILRDRGDDPEDAPWAEFPVGSVADVPYTGDDPFEGEQTESAEDLGGPPRERERIELHEPRGNFFSPERSLARVHEAERRFVPKFLRVVLGVLEIQRRDVSANLKKAFRTARVSVDDIFDPTKTAKLFRNRVRPVMIEVLKASGTSALRGLIGKGGFIVNEATREFIAAEAAQMVQFVDAATKQFLSHELSVGVSKGESVDQLAARMNKRLRDRKRARTIARTEVGKANQNGQIQGYEQSGVVKGKEWNTSGDSDVRDSHQIDGQERALGQPFELANGALAQHPLDASLDAGDIINCRCFVSPVTITEQSAN